jgi:ABC-type methionine transport system ATPase subunit
MSGLRVRLVFPDTLVREPVLARLARQFPVAPNIRRASVEEDRGWIVCELEGDPVAAEQAIAWLSGEGVRVELLSDIVES